VAQTAGMSFALTSQSVGGAFMITIAHAGEEWEARRGGVGIGVGIGAPPDVTQWLVEFVCISAPDRGTIWDNISDPDPARVSADELGRALERALLRDVLERASEPLTLAQIAEAIQLEEEAARHLLYAVPHRIVLGTDGSPAFLR